MHKAEAILALTVVAYVLFHRRHYRRHRRNGCGVWYSLGGPFRTRITVSKRL